MNPFDLLPGEVIAKRAPMPQAGPRPGAYGRTPFQESKIRRTPNGQFGDKPNPARVMQFRNAQVDQIAKKLSKAHGLHVDLEGMTPEEATATARAIDRHMKDFPGQKKFLKAITTKWPRDIEINVGQRTKAGVRERSQNVDIRGAATQEGKFNATGALFSVRRKGARRGEQYGVITIDPKTARSAPRSPQEVDLGDGAEEEIVSLDLTVYGGLKRAGQRMQAAVTHELGHALQYHAEMIGAGGRYAVAATNVGAGVVTSPTLAAFTSRLMEEGVRPGDSPSYYGLSAMAELWAENFVQERMFGKAVKGTADAIREYGEIVNAAHSKVRKSAEEPGFSWDDWEIVFHTDCRNPKS